IDLPHNRYHRVLYTESRMSSLITTPPRAFAEIGAAHPAGMPNDPSPIFGHFPGTPADHISLDHRPANMVWCGLVALDFHLSPESDTPLYRQLYDQLASRIHSGEFGRGSRLPATRELAGSLVLNRATVSAAYELLESEGLISGQVGRGSYVTAGPNAAASHSTPAAGVDWGAVLDRSETGLSTPAAYGRDLISFVMSRPSRDLFPL